MELVDRRPGGQVIVGFAAETVESDDELIRRGLAKLARKGCDLLAVNAVGWQQGFEAEQNELVFLRAGGEVVGRSRGSKRDTAGALLDAVLPLLSLR